MLALGFSSGLPFMLVANDASHVRVHLATRTDQGQVSSSTDVQLRNRAQAAATC